MQRRRAFWLWMTALIAIVAAAALAGALLLAGAGSSEQATDVADRYLSAWQRHDWRTMRGLAQSPPPELVATYQAMVRDLGTTRERYARRSARAAGSETTVTFRAALTTGAVGDFGYDGSLTLVRGAGRWRVRWSPGSVHPQLTEGAHFATARIVPPRAPILAADGSPLTANSTTIEIGIEPRRIRDRAVLLAALQRDTGVSPAVVAARLDKPGVAADAFVSIVTISEDQYGAVRDDLYPIPGLVFRRNAARVAATPELGQHVIGTVGPVTAELLAQLGRPYTAADTVGLRGLERTFERRLAGTPDDVVQIVATDGSPPVVVFRRPGAAPQPVQTTLDLRVQRAAEVALAGVTQPSAFVAIRPSSGQVLAIVSTPTTTEFNRALQGQYPPGSTFKVVTSAALLDTGTARDKSTTCPPSLNVGGRTFTNFEGESQASLSFAQAFAKSCNTAFIQLGATITDQQLAHTAQTLGFGSTFEIGIGASSGSFPTPSGPVEHAESVIGQAKVTASPLEMTTVAAAVADGTWRSPALLVDPAPARPPTTNALAPPVTDALRSFMLGVVANGTGTAASVRGQPPVAGKTGTAEFGTATPPHTHAWFIGYRGDLAFGVLVEDAGVGGRVAAPLAAKFLNALR
jgi:cell division protein FtsI/penicillin-binding protein 2